MIQNNYCSNSKLIVKNKKKSKTFNVNPNYPNSPEPHEYNFP